MAGTIECEIEALRFGVVNLLSTIRRSSADTFYQHVSLRADDG
jgi:hypothetical protein